MGPGWSVFLFQDGVALQLAEVEVVATMAAASRCPGMEFSPFSVAPVKVVWAQGSITYQLQVSR